MKQPYHDCGVIHRYREYLPVTDITPIISLSEGSTPLIYSPRLSAITEGEVYLKYEGLNPTGSFKDRGMTMAISKAAEEGATTVLCASTGNTSASAAAYAARAGMKCAVILPAGRIAAGKMAQAYIYGAKVIAIEGNFDDALRIVQELGSTGEYVVVNSTNPYRIEGQKTAAFEIIEELGFAPDVHILPVGNAGNITAYWKGYTEYLSSYSTEAVMSFVTPVLGASRTLSPLSSCAPSIPCSSSASANLKAGPSFKNLGRTAKLPIMLGVQAVGAAPLYHGSPMDDPETIATAIRIGRPASWNGAMQAVQESGGGFEIVSDEEILAAQQWLASHEGIFAEPASVAPVAALLKNFKNQKAKNPLFGKIQKGATIVLTLTGHGLKDPDAAKHAITEAITVESSLQAVQGALRK